MAEQYSGGSSALLSSLFPSPPAVRSLADIMREQEADSAAAASAATALDTTPTKDNSTSPPHDRNGRQQKQQSTKQQSKQGNKKQGERGKPKKEKAVRPAFDPLNFAPKILAKRTEHPTTETPQPTQPPLPVSVERVMSVSVVSEASKGGVSGERGSVGERVLFVPSPAFSTAPQRGLTVPKPSSSRRTADTTTRPHNARVAPTGRTSSPAITSPVVPALSAATPPTRLFTPSLRLVHYDQLQALLSDTRDFYVIATIGMQRTGKSHVLNELLSRQGGWKGFTEADTTAHPTTATVTGHTSSGVDVIVTPERLLYIDTQPLLSPSVAEALQREERDALSHNAAVFNAAVAADMFDIQLPLLLLCLAHTLVVTVSWPIPAAFVSHMQTVFGLFAALSSTLLPRSTHSCHVLLLINRAQETSADSPYSLSPHQLQQHVNTLFASSLASFAPSTQVDVFLLPAKERGSLYDSSMRQLAARLWSLSGRLKSQPGREREREWGRRVGNVYNALVHSTAMRDQRKEVETRLTAQRSVQHHNHSTAPASVFSQSSASPQHHHSHAAHSAGGQQRGRGGGGRDGGGGSSGMTVPPSLYQRDSPATSHQKLYQPP